MMLRLFARFKAGQHGRPEMHIDHLVLVASDVEASVRFYARVLDAEVLDLEAWRSGRAEYPAIHLGSWKFNVHPADTTALPRARAPSPGALDFAVRWPGDVRSAMEHLAKLGVRAIEGPVAQEGVLGSGLSVYFRDPDGALIEFICYKD